MQLKLLGLIVLLITNGFKKRKEEKPMQTKENLSQTVKDVKVMETFSTEESCIRILFSLLKLQNENWESKLVRDF